MMFTGTISVSIIYTRELVKKIMVLKSSGIVLIHNHPSGCAEPSMEDKTITMKIAIALASIDVALHDHIIIGDGYHSMADSGWLEGVARRFKDLLFERS